MKRYHYVNVPILEDEALRRREDSVSDLREEMAELQRQIDERLAVPLVTEERRLVEVLPGEPGYEEAGNPSIDTILAASAYEIKEEIGHKIINAPTWAGLFERK